MTGTYLSQTYTDKGVVVRVCSTCGSTKPLHTEFHRNGLDENGQAEYRLDCKVCYNAKRKENRVSNKHAEFLGHQRSRGEADINYTYTEWRETVIFFGGMCCYCGRTMRKGETLTRDHLVAVNEGGKTEQENVLPACKECNCSKGKEDWKTWFMKQSFFSQERMNKIFQWRNIIRVAGGGDDNE
jgi:hypothetical protein